MTFNSQTNVNSSSNEEHEKFDLKGGKGQNWEGGLRVPALFRWIGHIPPSTVTNEFGNLMDIMPTILQLINVNIPDRIIDGKSLFNVLIEPKNTKSPHDFFFHYCSNQLTAMRYHHWKLHFITPTWDEGLNNCPSKTICHCKGITQNPPLLFNLENDPSENFPINSTMEIYQQLIHKFNDAKKLHLESIHYVPPQLSYFPRPWLMDCCDPPKCECCKGCDIPL